MQGPLFKKIYMVNTKAGTSSATKVQYLIEESTKPPQNLDFRFILLHKHVITKMHRDLILFLTKMFVHSLMLCFSTEKKEEHFIARFQR